MSASPMVGHVIDTYRIIEILGKGGMGVVYKAMDTSLEKLVALKVMNPTMAEDERFLGRFKAEARALGRLQHPNIVNVFAFRHIPPHLFIVMEYVEGGTLTDLIQQRGPLPPREALPLMRQSLSAIGYAHHAKVIHRDIKPRNLLLTTNQQVKVTDFGLAKIQVASDNMIVTRTGFTGGTLYYMPPEQLQGLPNVDHRGDIYSLGMSFYEMLAGRTPFDKTSSEFAILKSIDAHDFPSLDQVNPTLPAGLVHVVMKAIERDPGDRFQSAEAMIAALDAWERNPAASVPAARPVDEMEATQVVILPSSLSKAPPAREETSRPPTWDLGTGGTAPPSKPPSPSRPPAYHPQPADMPATNRRISVPILVGSVAGVLLLVAFLAFSLTGSDESSPPDPDLSPGERVALTIRTVPDDAAITINGEQVGRTPLVDHDAAAGPVTVHIEKSGFAAFDTSLTLTAGEPAFLFNLRTATSTITPSLPEGPDEPVQDPETTPPIITEIVSPGRFRVESTPSGSEVYVNNRRLGTTPFSVQDLEPGNYALELRRAGYRTHRQSVTIRSGDNPTVRATLSQARGVLSAVIRPYGDLFVNGDRKIRESNRLYEEELPVGTYRVRAVHPEYGTWEQQIRVSEAASDPIMFDFRQEYRVNVYSSPSNAQILVDGRSIGMNTPKHVALRPGQHTITVSKAGCEVQGAPQHITVERDMLDPGLGFQLRCSN